jgi:hypothetical protein
MIGTKEKIARKLKDAMTVEQLIEELQEMPMDAQVVFTCDYGDLSHTQQALLVTGCRELDSANEYLDESGYSQSGLSLERFTDVILEIQSEQVVILE